MRKIRRWLELSWGERALLVRAVVQLVIAKLGRRRTSYDVVRRPKSNPAPWVEHEGVVLLDEEASRFVAFDAPILSLK